MMTSGLILNEDVHWICFHGLYDFAYILKFCSNQPMPKTEMSFNNTMNLWFINYYDLKYIAQTLGIKGGLNKLAQNFEVILHGIGIFTYTCVTLYYMLCIVLLYHVNLYLG